MKSRPPSRRATNADDLSIFTRPTVTAVSYTARSWSGPGYADAYPSGWRTVAVTALFNQAIANFNPVTAASTWLQMDQKILTSYWVRPLFTSPSLVGMDEHFDGRDDELLGPGFARRRAELDGSAADDAGLSSRIGSSATAKVELRVGVAE